MSDCGNFLLFAVGCLLIIAHIEATDNKGKSFLVTFIPNANEDTDHVIVITSHHDAVVHVDNLNAPPAERRRKYKVSSTQSLHVELSGQVAVSTNQMIEKKAVFVVASQPVTLYGFSLSRKVERKKSSTGGYLALPLEGLGTNYLIATFLPNHGSEGGQVVVAAAENDTLVNVTLRVLKTTTCGKIIVTSSNDTKLSFHLQSMDVVRVLCDGDITGSVVDSSKPVAVISGNSCAQVPDNRNYCDHLVEMIVPMSALATRYILPTFPGSDSGAIYRVVPSKPKAQIIYGNGLSPSRVGDLPFYEFKLQQGKTGLILADTPVMVVAYVISHLGSNATHGGNSFMTLLPSPDLAPADYLLNYDIDRYASYPMFACYVTAVVRDDYSQGLYVGDQKLVMEPASEGFSIGFQKIGFPTRVYHDNPLAAVALMTHCFTEEEGFGFPAGYTLNNLTAVDYCVSSPCKNGGTCYNTRSTYNCYCREIFGGKRCEQDLLNECDSNPCLKGATCRDGILSFTCTCPPGHTGSTCRDVTETTTSSTVPTTTKDTTASKPPSDTTKMDFNVQSSTILTESSETPEPLNLSNVQTKQAPRKLCPCSCAHLYHRPHASEQENITGKDLMKEFVEEIKEELAVDVKNTSRGRQRYQSAVDMRVSATGLGLVSVSLLAIIVGFIIALDVTTLMPGILFNLHHRQKKSSTAGPSQSQPVKINAEELNSAWRSCEVTICSAGSNVQVVKEDCTNGTGHYQ